MSALIDSINSKVIHPLVEASKVNVTDQVKTAPAIQKPSDPDTIVTLGQSKSQTVGLYTSAGVAEKSFSPVIPGKTNTNSAPSASATQFSEQNQKQLKNYSVIQQSLQTAATPQSDRTGTAISFLI